MTLRNCGWVALLPLAAATLYAQEQVDPPSRVARLNYVLGNVSYRPGSLDEWAAAAPNYPLTTGDRLWTDANAAAEMRIGLAAFRLAGQTGVGFLNLDDRATQVSLSQGTMTVRVGQLGAGEAFEVDTPNGAITLQQSGEYRIDVNSEANFTSVIVRTGAAVVTGEGQQYEVARGQQTRFSGTDQIVSQTDPAPGPDSWDRWCEARDQRTDALVNSVAAYVPPDLPGAEDLADGQAGNWSFDMNNGPIWVPRANLLPAGWQPYKFGHWAYIEPWGWTWVDDAPWGYAPFHFGRWMVTADGGWAWAPGRMHGVVPPWSPALVSFVGDPELAGWVVLAPGEPYRPWFYHSGRYLAGVNVDVNMNFVGAFANMVRAIAVPRSTFVAGGHVAGSVAAARGLGSYNVGAERPTTSGRMGGHGTVSRPPVNATRSVVTRTPLTGTAANRNTGSVRAVANPTASSHTMSSAPGMSHGTPAANHGTVSAAPVHQAGNAGTAVEHTAMPRSPSSAGSASGANQFSNPALKQASHGSTPGSNVTNPALVNSRMQTSNGAERAENSGGAVNARRTEAPMNHTEVRNPAMATHTEVHNPAVANPAVAKGSTGTSNAPGRVTNPTNNSVNRPGSTTAGNGTRTYQGPTNSANTTQSAPNRTASTPRAPSPTYTPTPRVNTPTPSAPRVSAPSTPAPRVSTPTPAPHISVPIRH